MREPVMILPPDGGGDQQIQRSDGIPPGKVIADLQPFRVLVEHRVDDVDEGFVRREESVATSEQVTFQHSFESVLAQHLHDAAVRGEVASVIVFGKALLDPEFLAHFVEVIELVRSGFVRTENAEVRRIRLHDVGEHLAERTRVLCLRQSRLVRLCERSRGSQVAAELSSVDRHWREDLRSCVAYPMGDISANSGLSLPLSSKNRSGSCECIQLLKRLELHWVFLHGRQGNLVGAPDILRESGLQFRAEQSILWANGERSSAIEDVSMDRSCAQPADTRESPECNAQWSRPLPGACSRHPNLRRNTESIRILGTGSRVLHARREPAR